MQFCPGAALSAFRWNDVRDHSFHDYAILLDMRSQPPHGRWYVVLCLYAKQGIDLKQPLRAGVSREDLISLIRSIWKERQDRGAEERKELEQTGLRGRLIGIEKLREDPHLEMHARGG